MNRALATAILTVGALVSAPACAVEQPPRWINADGLRVRGEPGLDKPVKGVLQRGTRVILKRTEPLDGFCLIEGDGQSGFVACQYLSAQPVARPQAGQAGVPEDQRWITGTAVNMRTAPARDAQVLMRLAVNRTVRLLNDGAGAGYCEVQPLDRIGKADGPSGFTACQYLGIEPLSAGQAAGYDDDPVRAFWRSPGWWKLESHAQALAKTLPESAKGGPWPRDEQLERMKAHLALGLKGVAPKPLADWAQLKALAGRHDPAILSASALSQAQSSRDEDLWKRKSLASQTAGQIQDALGLRGPLHDAISSRRDGSGERLFRLMQALELPEARPSLFRSESEVGPPGENVQQLAGRFDRIYRTVIAARQPHPPEGAPNPGAGLYDMLSRTESLSRPVQFVQLYRDGSLRSEVNTASSTELLWRDVDEPMCEGWQPGFGFGDVDGSIWSYFNEAGQDSTKPKKRIGPVRLFAYNALQPPPRAKASRSERVVKLDRNSTGFVRFTQTSFDIDGDGEPDLIVLEGVGPGPGHIEGPTNTDDPWYRLLVANIGGAWKVLGHDTFSYGCGC